MQTSFTVCQTPTRLRYAVTMYHVTYTLPLSHDATPSKHHAIDTHVGFCKCRHLCAIFSQQWA